MSTWRYTAWVAAVLLASCSSKTPAHPTVEVQGAIAKCLETYASLSREVLPQFDHIYVVEGEGVRGLLFALGESGEFGIRSSDYTPILQCILETASGSAS
jgi:hypothetical protein